VYTSTAVFAGIGTVVVAIAVGLSGGLIANVMSPRPLKQGVETARLEQRAAPEPMPAHDAVPYVGAALAFIDPSIGGAAAAHDRKAAAGSPAPRTQQAGEATASGDQAARPADIAAFASQTEGSQQGATDKEASAPEDAYARARAADQRSGAERRRAERAHRWVYRHRRYQYSYDQQGRDDSDWTYSDRRYREQDRSTRSGWW